MITELKRLNRSIGMLIVQIEATFIRIGWECAYLEKLIAPFLEEVGLRERADRLGVIEKE